MPIQDKTAVHDKPAPCRVTYYLGDQQAELGTSVSFHERGMLVKCDKPVQINKRLRLVLKFPGLEQTLEIQGIVVWTNIHGPADELTPRAMGIKFLSLDRNVERLLAKLASHYDTQGGAYKYLYS